MLTANELLYYRLGKKRGGGGGGGTGGGDNFPIGDGNTHLWVSLPEGRTSPMVGVCPNGTVTVDWGDGTTPDVLTGTSVSTVVWTPKHNYAKAGDYVVTLTVDGEMGLLGSNNTSYIFSAGSSAPYMQVYTNSVLKIELGQNVTSMGLGSLRSMRSLRQVRLSVAPTNYNAKYFFYNCSSLQSVTIPEGFAFVPAGMFYYCESLKSVDIPDTVTYLSSSAFSYCMALTRIKLPGGLTEIKDGVFQGCYSLAFLDFSQHTAVPKLVSTNAFQDVPADCKFRVPAALVDEWKAATNWATYADKIVGGVNHA